MRNKRIEIGYNPQAKEKTLGRQNEEVQYPQAVTTGLQIISGSKSRQDILLECEIISFCGTNGRLHQQNANRER